MKRVLESSGATILYYINYNAFIVRADASVIDRVAQLSFVRWTGVFEPAYKLSPRLSQHYDAIIQSAMDAARVGGAVRDTPTSAGADISSIGKSLDAAPASLSFGASLTGLSGASAAPGGALPGAGASLPRVDTSERLSVQVVVFERSGVSATAQMLSFLGAKDLRLTSGFSSTLLADVPRSILGQLARAPTIMWIDRTTQPYVFNDLARWVIQSGDSGTFGTPIHDQGIWGTGQVVTVGDTGIDFEHDAFEDPNNTTPGPGHRKVTDYYPGCADPNQCDDTDNGINHGTHVSGSVAGDDGVWHVYDGDASGSNGSAGPHDGQAFDATLQVQDLSADGFFVYFDQITDLWNFAVNRNSREHTNSWGSCCGEYIPEAVDTDNFVWTNQEFIILFAAGNSGSGLGSMNPFAGAKNVIAVGATVNGVGLENIADFSSRGPMNDGRLKPDIMTPGVSLWSARGCDPGGECDDYFTLSGTSMATPTAAGAAALVRQYFMDGWYPTGSQQPGNGFTPTAALVKALLINSAAEMTGNGAYDNGETRYPNFNQGWGRLLLDDAMFFSGETRGLVVDDHTAGLNTGDSVTYQLAIGDSSEPVEITLVWSDFPGLAGSNPNLVNDLDLIVTSPTGTVYHGNQFVGYNPGESEANAPGFDSLNNVESVLVISAVEAGLWSVQVNALNVPEPSQTFAIVMTGGIATERGIVQMDANSYQSSAQVNVRVVDTGLNVDPGSPDSAEVNMTSTTETVAELVTLLETGNATAVFSGFINLDLNAIPVPGDGVLQVVDGDTITAAYFDANDGLGGSGNTYDTAVVDDTAPVISGTAATNLRFNRATIVWTTNEASDSLVNYGTDIPTDLTKSDARRVTSHSIGIPGLTENTTYYFSVASTDEAGNLALDDNGGAYYTFTTPLRPPTAPPEEEWPTFHNNNPRLGASPSTHFPPMDEQWSDGPNLLQLWSGPVMANGMVYSTALDGSIRARDPYTGEVIWERILGGQYYYTHTPTVDGGVVYVVFYGGSGGTAYALDGQTGDTIWSNVGGLDFNARVQMAAADGLVFGSAWSGEVYALNQADGSVAWTYQTGDLPFGGPTVSAGQVFMPTIGGQLFALDEFAGTLIWSASLGDTLTSPPLFAQGNVYEGTYSGDMVALDAFTGEEVWRTSGVGLVDMSTPAYDGASIYFGSFNNAYYSLDATDGTLLWASSIGGPVGSSVAYANGFVYGTSWDGFLRTLDAFDGAIVDSDKLLSFGSVSMPAVSDGWVWVEDYDANIYGFLGQLPVGLQVSPGSQAEDAVPDSTVDYTVTVKNVGISGPDVFDATVTLGALGWTVDLFESDGVTPLGDTDGDGLPDTGTLATGESVEIVIVHTVPEAVNPGDSDTATVTFTSNNDATRSKTARVTTTVPPPGVDVGPRAYFTPNPGDTVSATMTVRNTGGFPDTIDITAVSDLGWTIGLFEADGTTPLADSDEDGVPDVGLMTGLQSATIVVEVGVPVGTPPDTVQRTAVTGTSSLDVTQSGTGRVVIELTAPPDVAWPTFHNNLKRHGQSPSEHVPPISELWRSSPQTLHYWTGPVVWGGILYSTTLDGYIRARNPWSGEVLWSRLLGDSFYYTGTPAVYDGVVYATFYRGSDAGTVYALDAYTGATIWSVGRADIDLDLNARVAMLYADGMVIGASWGDFSNGLVYALDAADGTLLWTVSANGLPFGGGSLGAGQVYYGTTNGQVLGIDELTGAVNWDVTLDGTVTSPPLYAQGNVFVGTYSGTMYSLDALTGGEVWSTGGFGLIDLSTPAYDGTSLYFGSFNNAYYALDVGTGDVLWQTPIGGPVGSSVAYANGYVYGTSWDGQFRTLDALTGAIVDTEPLGSFASSSMPAIANGWIWLEDFDGRIYGFGGEGAGVLQGVAPAPGTADEVTVTEAVLVEGKGYDAFGNPVPVSDFDWTSLGGLGTVIEVTPSGDKIVYVAGAVAGVDTLELSANGFTSSVTMNVRPGSLDRVVVTPGGATVVSVVAGTTLQFAADSMDRFGNSIPGATHTWAVVDLTGSTISSTGLFTAGTAVGAGTITATDGTRIGTAIVQIVAGPLSTIDLPASPSVAAGGTLILSGTGRDAFGNAVSGATIAWSAPAGSILSLTPDGSLAMFSAPFDAGSVTVTASAGGIARSVAVSVVAGALAAVSSPAGSVAVAGTLDLGAVDLYGNAISRPITWVPSAGTVDDDGRFTAPTLAGTVIITALEGARAVTRSIEVTPGPLARVDVTPASLTLGSGGATVLTASALDQYGNERSGDPFTWSTTIGTVSASPDGRTAALGSGERGGTGRVTVSSGAFSDTVEVTVVETALAPERVVSQTLSVVLIGLVIAFAVATTLLAVRNRALRKELGGRGPPAAPPPPPPPPTG